MISPEELQKAEGSLPVPRKEPSVRKRFLEKASVRFLHMQIYYKFQILDICKTIFKELESEK